MPQELAIEHIGQKNPRPLCRNMWMRGSRRTSQLYLKSPSHRNLMSFYFFSPLWSTDPTIPGLGSSMGVLPHTTGEPFTSRGHNSCKGDGSQFIGRMWLRQREHILFTQQHSILSLILGIYHILYTQSTLSRILYFLHMTLSATFKVVCFNSMPIFFCSLQSVPILKKEKKRAY